MPRPRPPRHHEPETSPPVKLPLHRDQAAALDRALHFGPRAWNELQQLATLARDHTPDADGYGHGNHADDGSRPSDNTSTTERAALTPSDAQTEALARAIHEAHVAAKHAAFALNALRAYLRPVAPPEPGRASTVTTCPACGELALPRPKAGYCPACYQAWDRAARPDRAAFEHERTTRAQRAEAVA